MTSLEAPETPMQVWHGLESIRQPFGPVSVAIGMFDGVHVGHQELIRRAVADARLNGRESAVFTFDRHAAEVFAPDRVPGYLSVPGRREDRVRSLQVDHLVIARFDARFRELSPEAFLHFVAVGVLGSRAVFVGEDFRFGKNQAGTVDYIAAAQERLGFRLHVLPAVKVEGEKASSTRVRQALREGDLALAERILGHPYVLAGTVVSGDRIGRTLGYPTANLALDRAYVVPADGIYAVRVYLPGLDTPKMGACSIGMRPTVGGASRTLETYLLDFDGDLYGQRLEIEFVARLRGEVKFDTLDALVQQMTVDVADARALLSSR